VVGLLGVSRIAAGESHTCAIKANGSAQCWGSNARGQLGTGNLVGSNAPVTVVQL
jgi:alpha-tubulin suppressor-like RCC1 family protein